MIRLVHLLSAICSLAMLAGTAARPQPAPPRWEVYAGCAAAYQANWQLRQGIRAPDMSIQIKDQIEEFKGKAIEFYKSDIRAAGEDALRRVETYMATNLEAYIDHCPPE